MAAQRLVSVLFNLSPDHVSGLDDLAEAIGLPSRVAVVRRLIDDALASNAGGMPSPAQVAELVRRLSQQEAPE